MRVADYLKSWRRSGSVLDETRQRFPSAGITTARLWLAVDRAPPYPADARLDRSDLAITGEFDVAGRFRSALGRLDGTRVTTTPHGLDLTTASLVAYRDDLDAATPVVAALDAGGFTLAAPLTGDPVYLVAWVDGLFWLVAQRSRPAF